MTGRVIVAPEYVDIDSPLIFLGGPIQGANDWQKEGVEIILDLDNRISIANPRRDAAHYRSGNFTPADYAQQVDWETHHLKRSANKGCILFWFAREAEHDCKRAFAQTTRDEFGYWRAMHQVFDVPIALGIDKGYTGEKYHRHKMPKEAPGIVIRSTLEEACVDAVRHAQRFL